MASLLEISKPEYDLMAVESIDRSTDNIVYRTYEPDVPLSVPANTATPQNIVYSIRDLGEFFLLADSYVLVTGKFLQATGGNLAAADNPALECASTSFFSQSRLRLNSQLIEDNSTLSHINAFIKQLTTLSPDYANTCGSNSGFILDQNTGCSQDIDYTDTVGERNVVYNAGYKARRRQAGGGEAKTDGLGTDQLAGQIVRSYVVRLADLFSAASCRKVMKNVSVRVELTTRTQAEMIFQGVGDACKFQIDKMQLVIAVHNPSLSELANMEQILASGQEINYQYLKYTTYESDSAGVNNSGYRSFTFNTSSQKPLGCFVTTQRPPVGGVSETLYNSMLFDNCSLTNLRVKINGRQYPYSEYEMSFSADRISRSFARPYEELLRYMNKHYDTNSGALINADDWANCYPIYWIPFHNLSPAPSYQITTELKSSLASGATAFAVDGNATNSRSRSDYKIYLTLLTVGEFSITGDRSGMLVKSQ